MNDRIESRTDPLAVLDAAYVLGALSPEDTSAFEEHLSSCESCARTVQELSRLPELLAMVNDKHVPGQPQDPDRLPALLAKVRSRRWRTIAAMFAAVLAVASYLALVTRRHCCPTPSSALLGVDLGVG
ncbi:hypothetical protein GCM10027597_05020 [Saccharopolyspora tripterygii]|uniref:anti-sigma factor family protein n=1 Tax=Saccharopolyspora sp. ID03-671 TaxID=3073066 RepID=UPI0038737DCB